MPLPVLACLLLLVPTLIPTLAHAEELSFEAIEMAREQYQEGSDAFRGGHYAEAEQRFQGVYEVLRTPSLLSDIGLAQERQGHWADAAASFEAYLRASPRVKNRGHVEQRIAELHQRAERQALIREAESPIAEPVPTRLRTDDPEDRLLGFDEGEPAKVEPPHKSRWWVWALVGSGVTVAAVGTGVGVGLAMRHAGPAPTDFPDIGPGSTAALLRF